MEDKYTTLNCDKSCFLYSKEEDRTGGFMGLEDDVARHYCGRKQIQMTVIGKDVSIKCIHGYKTFPTQELLDLVEQFQG